MKKIPADVNLTPIMDAKSTSGKVSVTINPPLTPKYDWRVFNLTEPSIVFAIVDDRDEVEAEFRPIRYGVEETFHFPLSAQYVLIGYDPGLLGGRSKPFSMGSTRVVYEYINAIFEENPDFLVYSKKYIAAGDKHILTIDKKQAGVKILLVSDDWVLGDEFTIGGYLDEP